ncbi:MAG TPA: phosphodiester glycosidase family protein [Armatimonadota bacterium]|nr:phosphodiester glycosidase family protein [Armatimonadota bacterium]
MASKSLISHNKYPIIALLLVIVSILPSAGARYEKELADGVRLIQDVNTDPSAANVVTVLCIDPKKPGVKLVSTLAGDNVMDVDATKGRETISKLVARKGALAGINADFFPFTGDPLGLAITGGVLVSEPMNRAAVGITDKGQVVFDRLSYTGTLTTASNVVWPLRGINRPRGQNELVLLTPIYGKTTGGQAGAEAVVKIEGEIKANTDIVATVVSDPAPAADIPIPADGAVISTHGRSADFLMQNIRAGDKLTLRFNITTAFNSDWSSVMEAVGGGPWLVRNGQVFIDATDEGFDSSFTRGRHPRTAIGVNSSGEILLVAVDGRQSISRGMSLEEMAGLMKSLGAVNAINLDGGGSTALSIKGVVSNSPSEGIERPVANALLVYANPRPTPAIKVKFSDDGPLTAASGEGRLLQLVDESTGQPVDEQTKRSIVWGTTGGIGFVNQEGWFVPIKARNGAVTAIIGDQKVQLSVKVVPGKPTKLTAKMVTDPAPVQGTAQIEVKLTDSNGNVIPDAVVTISVAKGTPDCASKTTNDKGIALFDIIWDSVDEKGSVKVTSGSLSAEVK